MNYNRFAAMLRLIVFTGAISLTLTSCLKDEKIPPKSMEQIKAEEGIPVTISEVMPTGFTKELSYFATLIPFKETVEMAKVSDKIVNIHAKVGDVVKEGQVIMEFPSSNPTLQYEQAKAALDNAEITAKRMKELLAAGEIAQQMYDNANTQYIVAKRNFEQLNQLLTIKSPASGTVITMPYRIGDVPKLGEVLFSVAMTNKMIAKVNVSDSEISYIKKGMTAEVRWNGNTYTGIVSLIGLEMSQTTRSFPIEIELNNSKNELRSGVSVEVFIRIAEENQVIAIDRKFILDESGNKFVFVENGGVAAKRQISTGKESGVMVEITSGLNAGDRLISCCTSFLEDGAKIKVETIGNR
ncbi:MAG: efflux RND transporter periplasmic adaptor subunit [Candidatus Kapaibacterium sp.]|nr:efflux RND transporter periplasmic adaptor subunit [Candidatus Kapabacteria bacterium]